LSESKDLADIEIRDYVLEDKDGKSIEVGEEIRSSVGQTEPSVGWNKLEDMSDIKQRYRVFEDKDKEESKVYRRS
jgi:hypothetical protein